MQTRLERSTPVYKSSLHHPGNHYIKRRKVRTNANICWARVDLWTR